MTAKMMNCLLFVAVFLPFAWSADVPTTPSTVHAQREELPIEVGVDPRIELISIVFRLAGNPEYSLCRDGSYARMIDYHFGPHKDHRCVELARELRSQRGVSYDAPMGLAVRLTDPPELAERINLWKEDSGLDGRWPHEKTEEWLDSLRDFARVAHFDDFYTSNQLVYNLAAERMENLLRKEFRFEWFETFFGERPGAQFRVVLGMVNGPANYGSRVRTEEGEEIYSIVGVWRTDLLGNPTFDSRCLPTLVHEFCHSYCNPIVDAHASELESAGKKIFAQSEDRMRRMAYGNWKTVMRESLVRASVVRYLRSAEGEAAAQREIERQERLGFKWIRGLSALLEEYEATRDVHPTLDSFFPRIVAYYDNYVTSPDDGETSHSLTPEQILGSQFRKLLGPQKP
jgi:hypothetical protein